MKLYVPKNYPICLVVLSLVGERISLGGAGGAVSAVSVPQVIILLLGGWAGLKLIMRGCRLPKSIFFPLFFVSLFVFFEVISQLINAPDGFFSLVRSRGILVLLVLICFSAYSDRSKDIGVLLVCVLVAVVILEMSIILSSLGVVENQFGTQLDHRYIGTELYRYRSSGLFLNYGDVAIMHSLAIVAAVEIFRRRSGWLAKSISVVFLILLPFSILGSESRNSLVAVFVAFSAYGFLAFKRKYKKHADVAVWCMVAAFFIFAVVNKAGVAGALASQMELRGKEDSRGAQYMGAIGAISDAPLLGVGPNQFRYQSVNSQGVVEVAVHNVFLQALVRSGIGGFFLFLSFISIGLALYRNAMKFRGAIFPFAMYCGWLSAIQFYPPLSYGSPIMWFPFALFLIMTKVNSVKSEAL